MTTEVSNLSQSLATAAYAAQQQQQTADRTHEKDRAATQAANDDRRTAERRSDNVNFSSEALRLSAQTNQANASRSVVNRANEGAAADNQQARPATSPQVREAEAAKSVAQAINAYHTTSSIR
jgi:hypothetical protein